MCLWCCWKDLDEQDLMECIWQDFGFRMWEILILKWFSTLENSNKFQKIRFWKEKKSVENVVIFGPMPEATLVCVIFVQRKKIDFPLFSITLPSSTPMQRINLATKVGARGAVIARTPCSMGATQRNVGYSISS
jgi:hypothetical protein